MSDKEYAVCMTRRYVMCYDERIYDWKVPYERIYSITVSDCACELPVRSSTPTLPAACTRRRSMCCSALNMTRLTKGCNSACANKQSEEERLFV